MIITIMTISIVIADTIIVIAMCGDVYGDDDGRGGDFDDADDGK